MGTQSCAGIAQPDAQPALDLRRFQEPRQVGPAATAERIGSMRRSSDMPDNSQRTLIVDYVSRT